MSSRLWGTSHSVSRSSRMEEQLGPSHFGRIEYPDFKPGTGNTLRLRLLVSGTAAKLAREPSKP